MKKKTNVTSVVDPAGLIPSFTRLHKAITNIVRGAQKDGRLDLHKRWIKGANGMYAVFDNDKEDPDTYARLLTVALIDALRVNEKGDLQILLEKPYRDGDNDWITINSTADAVEYVPTIIHIAETIMQYI